MPEYESWKQSLGSDAKHWTIKYYKGLGTSTDQEGKEYFQALGRHKKDFVWENDDDGDAIELAFSKKKIEARKSWLRQFEPGTYLDQEEEHISYRDFVHKELILFSIADLQRSIPSMVDGLKPGQRKILFCSFKRNFIKEAKVAQFSGYVSEHSAYHHGEQSLASTIIGMAQDYVGSNNINLLLPNGQFGTRVQGGKDHASARYIFTQLSPSTRFLFPKADDMLLNYLNEDGQSIEPTWYMPVIPMVLVNGSEGIGTGWSTFIPNYNPRDIIANVRRLLNGEEMEPMHPWYRGFKGLIERSATREGGTSYTVTGTIEEVDETTLRITELPVRKWTQDYKEYLESVSAENDKSKDPFIEACSDYSTPNSVNFVVYMTAEGLLAAKQEGLLKKFKLTSSISTSNMHLFDSKGVIKKYDTPEQILEEFFHMRLEFYDKRKKALMANLEHDLLKCENKCRFIKGVVEGTIIVSNRKRADLFHELKEKGFTPFPKKKNANDVAVAGSTDDTEENEENASDSPINHGVSASDYDYLIAMAIGTLTVEKMKELHDERDKALRELEELKKATAESLWMRDVDALELKLDELEDNDRKREKKEKEAMGKMKITKPVIKNARKNSKKATTKESAAGQSDASTSTTAEADNNGEVKKPRAKAAATKKKGPAKKAVVDEDDDEEVADLRERIAAYNFDSSPDRPEEMETEVSQLPAAKKVPSKRAPAAKKKASSHDDDDDDEDLEIIDDDDFEPEKNTKKGGRKPANAKAAKPPAGAKKRGPSAKQQQSQLLGQKLITEVLQPAENSPEKKVRKMRDSPFNKKSSSVLGRTINVDEDDEDQEEASADVAVAPKARPQRANRRQTSYIISDSDNDDDSADNFGSDPEEAENDSDFIDD